MIPHPHRHPNPATIPRPLARRTWLTRISTSVLPDGELPIMMICRPPQPHTHHTRTQSWAPGGTSAQLLLPGIRLIISHTPSSHQLLPAPLSPCPFSNAGPTDPAPSDAGTHNPTAPCIPTPRSAGRRSHLRTGRWRGRSTERSCGHRFNKEECVRRPVEKLRPVLGLELQLVLGFERRRVHIAAAAGLRRGAPHRP